VTGPWYLLARYRWTILWITYIGYLIFVFRFARGTW
jgi:hypothetical protein